MFAKRIPSARLRQVRLYGVYLCAVRYQGGDRTQPELGSGEPCSTRTRIAWLSTHEQLRFLFPCIYNTDARARMQFSIKSRQPLEISIGMREWTLCRSAGAHARKALVREYLNSLKEVSLLQKLHSIVARCLPDFFKRNLMDRCTWIKRDFCRLRHVAYEKDLPLLGLP